MSDSRWVELYATSPSGKTLFVCRMCGRISPTPDRNCPEPPATVQWKGGASCAVLEEMESAIEQLPEDRQITRKVRLMLSSDGKFLSWEPLALEEKLKPGACGHAEVVTLPASHAQLPLAPDGTISNCALANFDEEKNCQMCQGQCPQRRKYKI